MGIPRIAEHQRQGPPKEDPDIPSSLLQGPPKRDLEVPVIPIRPSYRRP